MLVPETQRPARLVALVDQSDDEARMPCQRHDPELWFPKDAETARRAQALCQTCPIVRACLDVALHTEGASGVWGGELFESGVLVTRKRYRGRPRRDQTEQARLSGERAVGLSEREASP